MDKKIFCLLSTAYYILLLLAPFLVSAHTPGIPYWGQGGLLSCDATKLQLGQICSFCELLHTFQHFIYFGITLVLAGFGPVLVAWGGLMVLISGGNESRLENGKKILTGALISIALALGSFVIINTFLWVITGANGAWATIDCGKVNNLIPGQNAGQTSGSSNAGAGGGRTTNNNAFGAGSGNKFWAGGGGASGRWDTLSDSQARQNLVSGIDIKAGVSLEGILPATIDEVNSLKKSCSCSVAITSGTEGVHDIGNKFSHINGYKVDLRLNTNLNSYITNNFQFIGVRSDDGASQYRAPDGAIYAKEEDHWDVLVKS